MQNFQLKHKKFPQPIQIAKFPYSLPFSQYKEAIIRRKGPEDEEKEEEDKQEIKKTTKQSGHQGTSDKKYFGDMKKQQLQQRQEWILDTKVPQKPLFEGIPTETDKNTTYYVFILIDKDFYAIPVESLWLHFKPFLKSTISLEKAEEIMNKQKEMESKIVFKQEGEDEEEPHSTMKKIKVKKEDDEEDLSEGSDEDVPEDADEDREFKSTIKAAKQKKQKLGEAGKNLKKLLKYNSDDEEEEEEEKEEKEDEKEDKKKRKITQNLPPEKKQKLEQPKETQSQPIDKETIEIKQQITKFVQDTKPTTKEMESKIKKILKSKGNDEKKKLKDLIIQHIKATTITTLNEKKEKIYTLKN